MINRKLNIIFVHIPKNGGSSISSCLGLSTPWGKYPHNKAQALRKYVIGNIGKGFWKAATKFAVIRNPWDRLVSAFCYLNSHKLNRNDTAVKTKYLSRFNGDFKRFVLEVLVSELGSQQIGHDNLIVRNEETLYHMYPQVYFIRGKKHLLVDHLLSFSRLQGDFNAFCRTIGIKPRKLPHNRKSRRDQYRRYYDDETAEVVGRIYSEDVAIGNFTF